MSLLSTIIIDLEHPNVEGAIISLCRSVFDDHPHQTVRVSALTGGTTNKLFKVSGLRKKQDSVTVLVRIFGAATGALIDRDAETYYLLQINEHWKRMVPEVYCRFSNGMIYEYFEGRSLEAVELPEHCEGVARHMAKWHGMQVKPFDAEKGTKPAVFDRMSNWLEESRGCNYEGLPMNILDVEREMSVMQSIVESRIFPVRFCHNDLPSLNVVLDESTKSLHFIDYEYAAYNYRGFDIGNHFNEFTGLALKRELYPSHQVQCQFARAYLLEDVDTVTEESVEELVREANLFGLCSHLLWAVWGLVQERGSEIDFDYRGYVTTRMQWYLDTKDKVLSTFEKK
jgi:ethanolamine kinase